MNTLKQPPSPSAILLTGATGYLGSKLFTALVRAGHNVVVLKRSTSNTFRIRESLSRIQTYDADKGEISQIFEDQHIETIIHCATDYGRKNTDPMQIIEANLTLPVKLLECARIHGVKNFVNTDTILDKNISHYSLSKQQFKEWLCSYQAHLACVNIVLGHFYGSGDDTTKFVSFISNALIKEVPTIELTRGEQLRNFVHVDDVVAAFMIIINSTLGIKPCFSEFQVCGNEDVAIKDVVLLMREISKNTKTELRFGAVDYRANEVMSYTSDTSAIRDLGWAPKYNLRNGLTEMIRQDKLRILGAA